MLDRGSSYKPFLTLLSAGWEAAEDAYCTQFGIYQPRSGNLGVLRFTDWGDYSGPSGENKGGNYVVEEEIIDATKWFHVVVAVDSTQPDQLAEYRLRLYVDGSEIRQSQLSQPKVFTSATRIVVSLNMAVNTS